MTDYDQESKCARLLDATSSEHLGFESRTFETVGELGNWLDDFVRGRGAAGEDLYRRCDGRCSPQYEWIISPDGGRLVLDTQVTCGHARNRSDNEFELSYGLRWTCQGN